MPFLSLSEVEKGLKVTARCHRDIREGMWKIKIQGPYILISFIKALPVIIWSIPPKYIPSAFQPLCLFITASTAKFVRTIPTALLTVSQACEKYALVACTRIECKYIPKGSSQAEIRSSMQDLSSDDKYLNCWIAVETIKCTPITIIN